MRFRAGLQFFKDPLGLIDIQTLTYIVLTASEDDRVPQGDECRSDA